MRVGIWKDKELGHLIAMVCAVNDLGYEQCEERRRTRLLLQLFVSSAHLCDGAEIFETRKAVNRLSKLKASCPQIDAGGFVGGIGASAVSAKRLVIAAESLTSSITHSEP